MIKLYIDSKFEKFQIHIIIISFWNINTAFIPHVWQINFSCIDRSAVNWRWEAFPRDHFNLCKSIRLFCFHQQWSERDILFLCFSSGLSCRNPLLLLCLCCSYFERERGRDWERERERERVREERLFKL
jgi:hypothetical protein